MHLALRACRPCASLAVLCLHPQPLSCAASLSGSSAYSVFRHGGGAAGTLSRPLRSPPGLTSTRRCDKPRSPTSISHHLRSHAAPMYSDLNSPPGTLYNVHARVWQRFLFSLDNRAVVARTVPGLHISASARVIEVGSLRVRRKSDVPLLPNSDKPTWVRIADPTASEITLTKSSNSLAPILCAVRSHCQSRASCVACQQPTPWQPLAVHQGRTSLVLRDLVHVRGAGSLAPAAQRRPKVHSLLRDPCAASPSSDGSQPLGSQVPVLRHACRF